LTRSITKKASSITALNIQMGRLAGSPTPKTNENPNNLSRDRRSASLCANACCRQCTKGKIVVYYSAYNFGLNPVSYIYLDQYEGAQGVALHPNRYYQFVVPLGRAATVRPGARLCAPEDKDSGGLSQTRRKRPQSPTSVGEAWT
jgi:hypothetical protein